MNPDILKVLYSQDDIKQINQRLAAEIQADYAGKNPLVVCILKGAILFMTDLVRDIDDYLEIDFMDVSSYGDATVSSGEVKIIKDLDTSVNQRDVLIVEDIVDTGRTLKFLMDMFKTRNANSVKICTLMDKPDGRVVDVKADYVGTTVPNEFVVGYGLDYAERYRNLPYIGVLKPEIYADK
ncbi:hypoxanthine phosphoribosyltransferase [Lacticaseibacillus saniviri]|uniref:Hypoxanthine phosphoribosyltransferase n=1 Tax=Lacticaseibacillus saniviri JCM 17471 = DSM 24301 TaxID=1293598 RepID=A0A0R2N2L7_9LACO|nr:hypoxanthine phosphoribosyltransferase [Lacticaseibacillus saniviri]KRO17242.1 hypoxanthine phosphoribosyltransferase [Lacticaseibacillus saniviri JCM 17471 = DSM 24301]MCG4281100.1 hypoxanthine phosphoribosyltransferase [Lacticaseibacillus saniviri]